jgi:hypothetical protein
MQYRDRKSFNPEDLKIMRKALHGVVNALANQGLKAAQVIYPSPAVGEINESNAPARQDSGTLSSYGRVYRLRVVECVEPVSCFLSYADRSNRGHETANDPAGNEPGGIPAEYIVLWRCDPHRGALSG